MTGDAQLLEMKDHPERWVKGLGAWVETKKCSEARVWTRSSFERAFMSNLEHDPAVERYDFEPCVRLPGGRWILPDFVVTKRDGSVTLVEVKASWVLSLPKEHKIQRRLAVASSYASSMGWGFQIWTEKTNAKTLTA